MENYNLELDKVIEKIKSESAKSVVLQLPSGLKPKATEIVSKLKEETGADVLVWMPGTFGACDVPDLPCDLLIQWGHSPWISTDFE